MANPTAQNAPPPASMRPTENITPGTGTAGSAAELTPGGLLPQPDNGAPMDTRVGTIPGDATLQPIQEFRSSGRRPSILSAPQGPDIAGHDPVLWTDIDGTYLARLYPGHFADAGNVAANAALEQGRRVQEQGKEMIANVQEPINWDVEGSNRPTDGPGPGGEQAGRPWDEQEAQRRGRVARAQPEGGRLQTQGTHPEMQSGQQQPGQPQTDEQRRQQQEREHREQQERERHQHEEQQRKEREEREKRGGKEA